MVEEKIRKLTDEEKQKIKRFEYLKKNRVAYMQGIYIALIIAFTLLMLEFISDHLFSKFGQFNAFLIKISILILLIIIVDYYYMLSIKRTMKPTFIFENGVATLEDDPVFIKREDGKIDAIFRVSDMSFEKGDKRKWQ